MPNLLHSPDETLAVAPGIRNCLYFQYSEEHFTNKMHSRLKVRNNYSSMREINYNRFLESAIFPDTLHVFLVFQHVEITIDLPTTDVNFPRLAYVSTVVTYQSRFIRAALLRKINDVFPVLPSL